MQRRKTMITQSNIKRGRVSTRRIPLRITIRKSTVESDKDGDNGG